jgi:hypothetical protein
MELSGQLHIPAIFTIEKTAPTLTGYAMWAPEVEKYL